MHEFFFYFFLNLIVIHIFFYVDLVRWQRIKATLKKKKIFSSVTTV